MTGGVFPVPKELTSSRRQYHVRAFLPATVHEAAGSATTRIPPTVCLSASRVAAKPSKL